MQELIKTLERERDCPPRECDADSYSRGIDRAIDEILNYVEQKAPLLGSHQEAPLLGSDRV